MSYDKRAVGDILDKLHHLPMHPYDASLLYNTVAEICETDPYLILKFRDGGPDLPATNLEFNDRGTFVRITFMEDPSGSDQTYDTSRFCPGIVRQTISTILMSVDLIESVTIVPS